MVADGTNGRRWDRAGSGRAVHTQSSRYEYLCVGLGDEVVGDVDLAPLRREEVLDKSMTQRYQFNSTLTIYPFLPIIDAMFTPLPQTVKKATPSHAVNSLDFMIVRQFTSSGSSPPLCDPPCSS